MNCQLNITPEDWARIEQCEAVIIREYESSGTRFAHAVAWGDLDEMEDQDSEPNVCIMPVGVSFITQRVLLVKEPISEDAEISESKLNQNI